MVTPILNTQDEINIVSNVLLHESLKTQSRFAELSKLISDFFGQEISEKVATLIIVDAIHTEFSIFEICNTIEIIILKWYSDKNFITKLESAAVVHNEIIRENEKTK